MRCWTASRTRRGRSRRRTGAPRARIQYAQRPRRDPRAERASDAEGRATGEDVAATASDPDSPSSTSDERRTERTRGEGRKRKGPEPEGQGQGPGRAAARPGVLLRPPPRARARGAACGEAGHLGAGGRTPRRDMHALHATHGAHAPGRRLRARHAAELGRPHLQPHMRELGGAQTGAWGWTCVARSRSSSCASPWAPRSRSGRSAGRGRVCRRRRRHARVRARPRRRRRRAVFAEADGRPGRTPCVALPRPPFPTRSRGGRGRERRRLPCVRWRRRQAPSGPARGASRAENVLVLGSIRDRGHAGAGGGRGVPDTVGDAAPTSYGAIKQDAGQHIKKNVLQRRASRSVWTSPPRGPPRHAGPGGGPGRGGPAAAPVGVANFIASLLYDRYCAAGARASDGAAPGRPSSVGVHRARRRDA